MQKKKIPEVNRKQFWGCSVAAALLLVCLLSGWEHRRQSLQYIEAIPGGRKDAVFFGQDRQWENWTDYLTETAQEAPYVFAFAEVSDSRAEFIWGFSDDREPLLTSFQEEKNRQREEMGGKDSLSWYFVKLRMDEDVHGLDVYRYLQKNFAEEGYLFQVWSLNGGDAYEIEQEYASVLEEQGVVLAKRQAIMRKGYLYLLVCEDTSEENREDVSLQMMDFEGRVAPEPSGYGYGSIMDEEELYWADHTERITRLENPKRRFREVRAFDSSASNKLLGYFPLLSEAEYQVKLAQDLPEMTIRFQIIGADLENGYASYLHYGKSMDEKYCMEVRSAEDGSAVQIDEVKLCIERTDTVSFEDLDGDGYLEMRIVYHSHGLDEDGIAVHHEKYWAWNKKKERLCPIDEEEILARKQERGVNDDGIAAGEEADRQPVKRSVHRGDSLWRFAQEYYGDGKRWTKIYEHNRAVIGNNPSVILEGTELEIP